MSVSPTTGSSRIHVIAIGAAIIVATAGVIGTILLGGGSGGGGGSPAFCGVHQGSDGHYVFPRLHVNGAGVVVNSSGCIVPLMGINAGSLGISDANGAVTIARSQWFQRNITTNVVRVNFNAYWWDTDVWVPKKATDYQTWLEQYISWQEAAGNYVMLDMGPHFPEPPCGPAVGSHPAVSFCPPQNQGDIDAAADTSGGHDWELENYITYNLSAWDSLAAVYANDAAVLYDAWNEPTLSGVGIFFTDMNAHIDHIRAQAPNSLIFVYAHDFQQYIVPGTFPNYTQPNLVLDGHIYDGATSVPVGDSSMKTCSEPGVPTWTPAGSGFAGNVTYAHAHGQGFSILEWGGCNDLDLYHGVITGYAIANNLAMAYFTATNLVYDGAPQPSMLNTNGVKVKTVYNALLSQATG